jgi:glycosyltransferase involved in cell wall biosynthesis
VDPADREYFSDYIKPLLNHRLIELIGEIGEDQKDEFLGNALALLFPIEWPEPFGLVLIDALACGTLVIAYNEGAVPEIIEDGKTGFIVDNQNDAVAAVDRLGLIDRKSCRNEFEKRFSAHRMASDYLAIYERIRSEGDASKKVTALPDLDHAAELNATILPGSAVAGGRNPNQLLPAPGRRFRT